LHDAVWCGHLSPPCGTVSIEDAELKLAGHDAQA